MNRRTPKIIRFASSLKVAIVLLILIAAYIVIGTLLPQHGDPSLYLERYPRAGSLIIALSLDKAYSSLIFRVLMALFSLNLTLCTVISMKGQVKQLDKGFFPSFQSEEFVIEDVEREKLLAYCNRRRYTIADVGTVIKAGTYRFGVLGATITHIGILVLFIGAVIGSRSASDETVNLLPGNQHRFEKQGFTITLDDFHMTFQESGAVQQYISTLTITDDDGTTTSEALWVNKPLHHKGLGFYQANFGWASNLQIADDSGAVVAGGLMRSGYSYFYQPSHLTIYLYNYYPEMGIGHQDQPVKMSEREIGRASCRERV